MNEIVKGSYYTYDGGETVFKYKYPDSSGRMHLFSKITGCGHVMFLGISEDLTYRLEEINMNG